MQFRDLNAQYNALKNDMDKAVLNVMADGQYILGNDVKLLETELAEYVGVKNCISCANGTDALILSLMCLDVGEGDAIFAPDFTYFATVNCAMLRGATPVLCDIDERTFNISPDSLEEAIKNTISKGKLKPRVIITVDLYGLCADYEKISKIAKKYGLIIIEDAAQGFGGMIGDKRACSFADIACTSFFPAKPLGCYGDGGAIFTDNDDYAEKLVSLRSQGRSKLDKYDNISIGLNSRLDTIQAAILRVKLKAFAEYELESVNNIAKIYTEELNDIVQTPYIPENYLSSWAQYTILLKDEEQRNKLKAYLADNKIPTMIYYPKGMHEQTALVDKGYNKGKFTNTDSIIKRCLSIPIHPYLNKEDQMYIINKIKECVR